MKHLFITPAILVIIVLLSHETIAQPGTLDLSFGGDGIVNNEWTFEMDRAAGMTVNSMGKIIVVTHTLPTHLLQFNSDGTPDSSFAAVGKTTIINVEGSGITLDSSDRILVFAVDNYLLDPLMYIYRYNPDGTKDAGFGQ
jgi:hypothetical protein